MRNQTIFRVYCHEPHVWEISVCRDIWNKVETVGHFKHFYRFFKYIGENFCQITQKMDHRTLYFQNLDGARKYLGRKSQKISQNRLQNIFLECSKMVFKYTEGKKPEVGYSLNLFV